jgi:hypothetical protein
MKKTPETKAPVAVPLERANKAVDLAQKRGGLLAERALLWVFFPVCLWWVLFILYSWWSTTRQLKALDEEITKRGLWRDPAGVDA